MKMDMPDDEILDMVTERLRVLAHPTRLKILHALQRGELCVSELVELIGESQVNVSRQLALLEKAGMVAKRKRGLKVYYSIRNQSILSICDLLCGFLKEEFAHQRRILKKLEQLEAFSKKD